MAARNFLGNAWGQKYSWDTDNGRVSVQGYDNGSVFNTPEAPEDGWNWIHALDDPQGDPDVIVVGGRRFRAEPG